MNEKTISNSEETSKEKLSLDKQKVCLVCGDKAMGCNFNVITCQSCKAFFRRKALASNELRCFFSNNCEITTITRKFCSKCRLDKCFSVGMMKEHIMSQDEKAKKRKKILENRSKKLQTVNEDNSVTSSSSDLKINKSLDVTESENNLNSKTNHISSTSDLISSKLAGAHFKEEPINLSQENHPNLPSSEGSPHPLIVSNTTMHDPKDIKYPCETSDILQQNFNDIGCSSSEPKSESGLPKWSEDLPGLIDNVLHTAQQVLDDVNNVESNSADYGMCQAIKMEFDSDIASDKSLRAPKALNEVQTFLRKGVSLCVVFVEKKFSTCLMR